MYIQNVTFVLATKSVGGFFSGLTSYVEENKEWVKSVAADATSAIKENVKVILLEFIINEIFNGLTRDAPNTLIYYTNIIHRFPTYKEWLCHSPKL